MNFANFNPTLNYNRMVPNSKMSYAPANKQEFSNYEDDISNYSLETDTHCDNITNTKYGPMQLEVTPVYKLFFSDENIARIQKKIKQQVYNDSKGQYKLDVDQNERDLFIVMRSIYLDNAKNLNKAIVRQVKMLNEIVVRTVMPDIMTNIKQYYGYLKDINTPLKPLMRPMNVNNAGRRTLPSMTTVWGF